MKAKMIKTMRTTMTQTAKRNTSLGSEGTQRRTAGSYTTVLNVLMQKETMADTNQVRTTMILVQVTDNTGYLPTIIGNVHNLSIQLHKIITNWQHGYHHLVHLEHGEHDHVLHPDNHRHKAVDVAQVGTKAPVTCNKSFT